MHRHDARTLILARTDAVAVEGLDAALDRAERYLEAGADALFIEALRSPARAVASTLQGYYANLHAQGTTAAWRERMLDFDGLNAVIGTPALLAEGKQYE
ncbi:carboxyvinyl-carboxyphosphonate phosphorylmutase [Pandoraea communis]|uniref:Carboxyvinyl-carboxyphosphonate phosphorylmutase n=1 Tax=Pandoraea communis TaxID=2508297 RepID=A0A5E4YK06_9BURK|nr:carboxyvinyl-carboxyphosphonate phosphorylmutase [Pandoraea communis]